MQRVEITLVSVEIMLGIADNQNLDLLCNPKLKFAGKL
jgi:hypothetical protein